MKEAVEAALEEALYRGLCVMTGRTRQSLKGKNVVPEQLAEIEVAMTEVWGERESDCGL